jgi:hypothetical protein
VSRTADRTHRRAPPRGAPISSRRVPPCSPPLTWTFDGPFAVCLTDIEDTLRRAIVQLGDISDVAIAIDLSLPALAARVAAGDVIQPAWSRFLTRVSQRYGLPCPLRVRPRNDTGPLATLVIVYRS